MQLRGDGAPGHHQELRHQGGLQSDPGHQWLLVWPMVWVRMTSVRDIIVWFSDQVHEDLLFSHFSHIIPW